MALNWGITAIFGEEKSTAEEITEQAIIKAQETGIVKQGDCVVVISSNDAVSTSGVNTLTIRTV